jgi:1-acyl-sn-glycerol-3-phosphate acyltransferase
MKRSCPRPIKFITAASSLRKPVIGPFMAAGGAIPL